MTRALWIAGLCLVVAGCASLPEPQWLQELRAREAAPMPPQTMGSKDRFFRARVPAKPMAPITLVDNAYGVRLDIGTESPIDCWVYPEGLDLAASISAISDATFAAISESIGELQLRVIDRVDAGAFGESPFLTLDWMYRIQGDGGPMVGQVKHLVATKGSGAVYCQHDEVGYAKTFHRVVGALVESIQYRKPTSPKPYFSQVSTLAIRDMRVGVEHTTLTRDADGDTRVDTRTSLLIPVDINTLRTNDIFAIEFATPNGALINQMHVETENGQLVTKLNLDPHPNGVWAVTGTFQTKPILAEIRPRRGPTSWLGEAFALRQTLDVAGIGGEITLERWVPQADPTRLLDETLSIERKIAPDRFAAKLAMAGLQADLVVDRRGSIASGSMNMGSVSVDIERVYVDGAL